MDTPPVETIAASSITERKDVDVKGTVADVVEEKEVEEEEPAAPVVVRPPHTSPDLSFATEVTLQNTDVQHHVL